MIPEIPDRWGDYEAWAKQYSEAECEAQGEFHTAQVDALTLPPGTEKQFGRITIKVSPRPPHFLKGTPEPKLVHPSDHSYKTTQDFIEASNRSLVEYDRWRIAQLGNAYMVRLDRDFPAPPNLDPYIDLAGSYATGFWLNVCTGTAEIAFYFHEDDNLDEAIPYLKEYLRSLESVDPDSFNDYTPSYHRSLSSLGGEDNQQDIPKVITAEQQRQSLAFSLETIRRLITISGGNLEPQAPPKRKRGPRLPELPSYIRIGTSIIEQGTGYNLARLQHWQESDAPNKRFNTHEGAKRTFWVTNQLPTAYWEALKNKRTVVIKAFHVFEALRLASPNPLGSFPITPDQILSEIKGDRSNSKFTQKEKIEAVELLEAILSIEVTAHWTEKQGGARHKTTGPLYIRTTKDELHEDLWGWVPHAVRIMANPDLRDGETEKYAKQNNLYHRAFLHLNSQKDEGAIILGSYILLKGRPQSSQYNPGECRFTNENLLKQLQEAGVIDVKALAENRQLSQIPKKVDSYLQKLKGAGLIEDYSTKPKGPQDTVIDELLDSEDSILKAFPEDLPESKRRGKDDTGKVKRGAFYEWLNSTTVVQLNDMATAAQIEGRKTSTQRKAMAARRQTISRRKRPDSKA